MDFDTKYSKIGNTSKYVSEPGSPIKIEYSSRYDENGDIVLEESGKINFQDYIESFAESSSLAFLVAKYEAGDPDALNQIHGAYMDITNAPTSYADLFNKVNEAQSTFENLPVDIKELFNNDPVKFFSSYGSKDFFDRIMSLDRYNTDKLESEVKINEPARTDE